MTPCAHAAELASSDSSLVSSRDTLRALDRVVATVFTAPCSTRTTGTRRATPSHARLLSLSLLALFGALLLLGSPPAVAQSASVRASVTGLNIPEGNTASYTVDLATRPSGDVVVTPISENTLAATVSGALTFTSENWNTPQSVIVTAVRDGDDLHELGVFIDHTVASSDSNYNNIAGPEVSITVIDGPMPTMLTLSNDIAPAEGAGVVTVTATLDEAVPILTEIQVTLSATGSAQDNTDYTLSSTSITLGTGERSGTVTITVTDDDLVEGGETITLSATATGLPAASPLSLTISDNDNAGIVLVPPPDSVSLTTTEGMRVTYTMALAGGPLANVTVTPAAMDTGAVTVSTSRRDNSLLFTPDNWRTPQTVTVDALQDDNAVSELAIINHTVSSTATGYDGLLAAPMIVAIEDDDTPVDGTFFITASTDEPVREGARVDLTITLSEDAPAGGLTFAVATDFSAGSAQAADIGAVASTVTIAEGQRSATLTVPIARDAVSDDRETFAITFTVNTTGWTNIATGASSASSTITIADTTGILMFVRNAHAVSEGLAAALNIERVGDISRALSFTVGTTNGSAVAPDDFIGSERRVTLAAGLVSTEVVIPTVDDFLDEGDAEIFTVYLRVAADTGYAAGAPATVTIRDDDTANVTLTPPFLLLTEGQTNTYTAVLDSQPTAAVTIALSNDNATALSLSASTLRFTTSNWNRPQTVTVTGLQDDDTDNALAAISHTTSSTDRDYQGLTVSTVSVVINDDDRPGILVSQDSAIEIREGDRASYTVVLNTRPASEVIITLAGTDEGAVGVSADTLTFTTSIWNRPQTVTVTGLQDDDANDELEVDIQHTASSSDDDYDSTRGSALIPTIRVQVLDDETAGVLVTPTALTLEEAARASYTVVLGSEPSETVTITPSSDNTAVSVSADSLIFTSDDWETVRTVTVSSPDDDDARDEAATISHTAATSDRAYGTLSIDSVTVTVNDNEGIRIAAPGDQSAGSIMAREGDVPVVYTITLAGNSALGANVIVSLGSSNEAVATVSPPTLTFTPDDRGTAQMVTITTLGAGEAQIRYTVTSSDSNYDGLVINPVLVTVEPPGQTEDAVSRALLSELSRVLADTTVGAVAQRIRQDARNRRGAGGTGAGTTSGTTPGATPGAGSGAGSASLAGWLKANASALSEGQLSLGPLLGNSEFALPLGAGGAGAAFDAGVIEHLGLEPATLTLWGSSRYRDLSSGKEAGLDWHADVFSAQLGLDARHGDWLFGVAGSWGHASTDYRDRTANDTARRKYRLTMSGIHPYVSWTSRALSLWLSGGQGWGELSLEHQRQPARVTSDVTMRLVAGGGSMRLWQRSGAALHLRLEGQQAWTKSKSRQELSGLSLQSSLLRAAFEGEHTLTLGKGSLTPSLALGVRHDGGDGGHGTGAELGSSLRWQTSTGWQAEGGARVFVGRHGYREWGLWGLVDWAPSGEHGWSLRLQPRYGREAGNSDWLWERASTGLVDPAGTLKGQLDLRLGYGLRASLGRLVPYSEIQLAESRHYRLGIQWLLGEQWHVDLAAGREEKRAGASTDHSLLLQGHRRY